MRVSSRLRRPASRALLSSDAPHRARTPRTIRTRTRATLKAEIRTTIPTPTPTPATGSNLSKPTSRRRRCPSMNSPKPLHRTISGRPAIGAGRLPATTGFPEYGALHPTRARFGLPATGGYYGNRYRFHRGFWGLYIGFYGGVNYGYGYFGTGYRGGYWNGPHFFYNSSVTRVNVTRITNVYNRTVIVNNVSVNRISYNGGRGGLQARPQPAEIAAMRAPRTPPMSAQLQVQREAAQNRAQFYNQNRGRPAVVAAPRPIMADRGIQRPAPIAAQARPVQQGRPADFNNNNRSGQPQVQPGQQVRPGVITRPNQPQVQPIRPNSNLRPQAGSPEIRPAPLQQPQQQVRPQPVQPQRDVQQTRPQQELRPQQQRPEVQQPRPQQELRQQQTRPEVQQPRPQPEVRQQQVRPQETRPAPQARPAPAARAEERPRR